MSNAVASDHAKFVTNGSPTFLLGVNYWARAAGPRMWERFDEGQVQAELDQMHAIGLDTCRCFAFIPSFMPSPPRVAEEPCARLRRFLDLCQDAKIGAIPTFLVGHMSGENHCFEGQGTRSLYTDPELLSWQLALARAIVSVGADHPAVRAYLASNEMPLWGGRGKPADVRAWAAELRAAVRERDARPFGTGDGVMNLAGEQNGFDVRTLGDVVDFYGPHSYYSDEDPLRQSLHAEHYIRSLTWTGKPVIYEEFGASACQVSEANQALFFRDVLHSALTAGATGALAWCFSDFALASELPYQRHAFELSFGITRADSSEKPVCDELRRFRGLLDQLDFATLTPPEPRAAILVPEYFNNTDIPFSVEDRGRMRRTLLQGFVACVTAGIETELLPEDEPFDRYALVVLPATQKLLAPTWQRLLDFARRGGTVYWSYFAGDYPFLQGMWCANFTELTGCQHQLRYGCPDLPAANLIIDGANIALRVATMVGEPTPRSCLPVRAAAAEVLARDSAGAPALLRARHGAGQVLFLNHPIEYYLSRQSVDLKAAGVNPLYRWLAREAGIEPRVSSDHPAVQTRVVDSPHGALLWVMNRGWDAVDARVTSAGGTPIFGTDQTLDEGSARVALPPKGVYVFRMPTRS